MLIFCFETARLLFEKGLTLMKHMAKLTCVNLKISDRFEDIKP